MDSKTRETLRRLGYAERKHLFFNYWIDPRAERKVEINDKDGNKLKPNEEGRFPLTDHQQHWLDIAIDLFEDGDVSALYISNGAITEYKYDGIEGLGFTIMRTSKMPFTEFSEMYMKVCDEYGED